METFFKKLIENVMLTAKQAEDARTKYNGICETLHDAYYPTTQYDGSTKLVFGSYGKSTNIRPPRDVDVLFKMPAEEFARFDALTGNKQSQLLQEIRGLLQDEYATTEEIRAFGKVVVVEFAEGTHSVELLPAWELQDGRYRVPDTENGGRWEVFDPMAEIKNIRESNKATGKTLDLIRISKKWVEYCNVPLKSFVIEHLAVEYLSFLNDESLRRGYAVLMINFLSYILGRSNSALVSVSGNVVSLGDEWKSRVESAVARAKKAVEYEADGKMEAASDEWKKLFGDDFPKAQDENSTAKSIALFEQQYPSEREEFLDRTYGIPFRIEPEYYIHIDAQVTQNGYRTRSLRSFKSLGWALRKKKKVVFRVERHNVPGPYSIHWKVRNFGDEAHRANQLRGEITPDRGFENKEEPTLYYGEHYVDCYFVKDGVCVAYDRIFVPIGTEYEI